MTSPLRRVTPSLSLGQIVVVRQWASVTADGRTTGFVK